jgi:hypothetical protein
VVVMAPIQQQRHGFVASNSNGCVLTTKESCRANVVERKFVNPTQKEDVSQPKSRVTACDACRW